VQTQTNQSLAMAHRLKKSGNACNPKPPPQGKILKVLPEESLLTAATPIDAVSLNRLSLVPGTAVATRATILSEGNQPDSICIAGFLTDLPQTPGVNQGLRLRQPRSFSRWPIYYTSVGYLQRTVRKFSTKLVKAVPVETRESE